MLREMLFSMYCRQKEKKWWLRQLNPHLSLWCHRSSYDVINDVIIMMSWAWCHFCDVMCSIIQLMLLYEKIVRLLSWVNDLFHFMTIYIVIDYRCLYFIWNKLQVIESTHILRLIVIYLYNSFVWLYNYMKDNFVA